jgi:hypothetical protein
MWIERVGNRKVREKGKRIEIEREARGKTSRGRKRSG